MRGSHFLLVIFLGAIVLPLGYRYAVDRRASHEEARVTIAEKILERKLEVYQDLHGQYPDSLEALSFTNSTLEVQVLPDIWQVKYQRTPSGYTLQYNSVLGYHSFIEGSTN
jgi:hypothetical protein